MVNVAKYFMTFLREESCGKCTACREGVAQVLAILDRISKGEGEIEDLDSLEELCFILDYSLCGLGNTAANPVRSTLRYFRDEYIAHVEEKRCPAKECKGLFRYEIVDCCHESLVPHQWIRRLGGGPREQLPRTFC